MDPMHETVNRLSCLIGSPVVVEDHRFNLVAHSPHASRTDQLRSDSILHRRCDDATRLHFEAFGIARAEGPMLVPASPDGAILARWCLPVRWRGVTQGYAWSFADADGPAAHLLDDAMDLAAAIGELMADRSRREEAKSRAVGRLLETMDADIALADIDQLCCWSTDQQVAVVVARGPSPRPPPTTLAALAAVRADLPGTDAVLLLPHEATARRPQLSARVSVAFGHGNHGAWVVGIGEPVPLIDARASWRQARAAVRAANADRTDGTTVRHWAELGVRRLLSAGQESWLADATVPASVRTLIEHPDPDLVFTVRTYLDLAGQAQLTADRLAIHRQTLYRRLRRVEEITGQDLMAGQDRLVLHLALTLAPDLANREIR